MAINLKKCLENMSALIRGWKLKGQWHFANGTQQEGTVWMHESPEGIKLIHTSFEKENGALGMSCPTVQVDAFLKTLSSMDIVQK